MVHFALEDVAGSQATVLFRMSSPEKEDGCPALWIEIDDGDRGFTLVGHEDRKHRGKSRFSNSSLHTCDGDQHRIPRFPTNFS